MKYIRTKDGNILKGSNYGFGVGMPYKNYGVKVADTIEELFDELVVHNPSNDGDFYPKHFVYKNKWETILQPMSDYQKSKGIEIYGAIWTDKGLIYKAKMKGILPNGEIDWEPL